jgi:hypothetical protein
MIFFIEINKATIVPRKSPPSLPHMVIGIRIEFLAHSYSRKYEIKLGKWQGAPSLYGTIYRPK